MDQHVTESRLRHRLSSLLQLSQEFSLATCEDEIITLLLRAAIDQTEALGVSFVPFDDRISAQFVTSLEQELASPKFKPWEEYLDAPSIRSQCRICRKTHVRNLMDKLNAATRTEAVSIAIQGGLLRPTDVDD